MKRFAIGCNGRFSWPLDGAVVGTTRTFSSLPEAIAGARELIDASQTLTGLRSAVPRPASIGERG